MLIIERHVEVGANENPSPLQLPLISKVTQRKKTHQKPLRGKYSAVQLWGRSPLSVGCLRQSQLLSRHQRHSRVEHPVGEAPLVVVPARYLDQRA